MITNIEEQIKGSIKSIIKSLYDIDVEQVELESPNDVNNGNLSTNVCLKITKLVGKNPMEIAKEVVDQLEVDGIDTIEVKKPGFINFFYGNEFFNHKVNEIIEAQEFIFDTNERNYYNVEYVSANPTGDLHLGHARNAVYGDSICRLLRKIGNKVDSEYYINDAGSQMNNLGLSVQYFYLQKLGIELDFPEDGYRGQEIQDITSEIYNEYGEDKKDEDVVWFREYAYAKNLEEIKRILKELHIEFDIWTSERSLYEKNMVEENLNALATKGDIYSQDDAMWLATSKYFDDKDRVLKKSDGNYTYFASDVAYHMDKFNRGYSNLIDVWGGDHHGYINRVKSSISSLGQSADKFEVLIIQMINILQNNERVKMSKRSGTSVTIKDLLKEIDADSLRYFFLMRSADTQVDFDIELAKQQNADNPIYYIQYAHARIAKLLQKALEENIKPDSNVSNEEFSDNEKEIIAFLNTYPKVVVNAANKRLPHLICNYLYDLASLYHRYYNQEHVFNDKNTNVNGKINIAFAIQKIIKDGLNSIGINAKDNM